MERINKLEKNNSETDLEKLVYAMSQLGKFSEAYDIIEDSVFFDNEKYILQKKKKMMTYRHTSKIGKKKVK